MVLYRNMFSGIVLLAFGSGCALEEVRSKNKLGIEWQHSGSDSTNSDRYTEEQGFEFKWDKGVATGVSYRRRDTDNGNGNNDNGVFVEFSFPIWKRSKPEAKTVERLEALERRLAELEAQPSEQTAAAPRDSRDEINGGSEQHVAWVTGGIVPGGQNQKNGD